MNQIPVIDYTKCILCGECISFCQHNVILKPTLTTCSKCIKYCISMDVPCNPEQFVFVYERCDFCGLCVNQCPHSAMYWYCPKVEKTTIH